MAAPATRKKTGDTPRKKVRVRARPMALDEITLADMATPSEIRRFRKISAEIASGKRRVRFASS
jgi:hypothetical protein